MKTLTITLDGLTLYDGPVSEINFLDGESRVGIQADKPKATAAPQVGSLLTALASARRQTAAQVEEVE